MYPIIGGKFVLTGWFSILHCIRVVWNLEVTICAILFFFFSIPNEFLWLEQKLIWWQARQDSGILLDCDFQLFILLEMMHCRVVNHLPAKMFKLVI